MPGGWWTEFGLEFDCWGLGSHHAAAIHVDPCEKCLGRGVVGIEPFTPVCPKCEGTGQVATV